MINIKRLLKKYNIKVNEYQSFISSVFSGSSFDAKGNKISVEVIKKLLLIPELKEKITFKGIYIKNAKFEEELDLDFVKVPFPMCFKGTTFVEKINLNHSKIESLILKCCTIQNSLNLTGAIIDGRLNLSCSTFEVSKNEAINARNMIVKGSVYLCGDEKKKFTSKAKIDLEDTMIYGNLNCTDAAFSNAKASGNEKRALVFSSAQISGNVWLSKEFEANGEVRLIGAQIGGDLKCSDGKFINPNRSALDAKLIKVEGDMFLDHCLCNGKVDLSGAKILGMIECNSAEFYNSDKKQNNVEENSNIVFLTSGTIDLKDGKIEGRIERKDTSKISKSFFKRAYDRIFRTTTVEQNDVEENSDVAVLAKGLYIDGPLLLNNITVRGVIDLTDAKIEGRFELIDINKDDARFEGEINCAKGEISVTFNPNDINSNRVNSYKIILKSAYAREFKENSVEWLNPNKIILNIKDFTYSIITDKDANSNTGKKETMKRKIDNKLDNGFFPNGENFSPQPYLQMAKVIEELGYERNAKYLRIKMNDNKLKSNIKTNKKIWLLILKYLVGYGYRPYYVLIWAFAIWGIGVALFCLGINDVESPMKPVSKSAWEETTPPYQKLYEHYTIFDPWMYSLDVFIPIVNLGQQEFWKPDTDLGSSIQIFSCEFTTGWFLLTYMYIEILFGWFLTSMLAIGVSGLVKQK